MKTNSKILGILFAVTSLTTVVNAQNTVTVGGENANPSTPDGTGGVKPADDPDSPYGNNDDGVDCG